MYDICYAVLEDNEVKRFIEILKIMDYMNDRSIPFDLRYTKIAIQVIHPAQRSLVSVEFPRSCFTEFDCLDEIIVYVPSELMIKFLENGRKPHRLDIIFSREHGCQIKKYNDKVYYLKSRSMLRVNIEKEEILREDFDTSIIPFNFQTTTTISNLSLSEFKRDLETIKQNGDYVTFMPSGIMLPAKDSKDGEPIIIEYDWEFYGKEIEMKYSVVELLEILKPIKSTFKHLDIQYGKDCAMVLKMWMENSDIELNGYVRPYIEETEEEEAKEKVEEIKEPTEVDRFIQQSEKRLMEISALRESMESLLKEEEKRYTSSS